MTSPLTSRSLDRLDRLDALCSRWLCYNMV